MADFCNYCAKEIFGENVEPEIDVYKIFEELKPSYMRPVLCEGCGLAGIIKYENEKLKVTYLDSDEIVDYYNKRKLFDER